LAVLTVLLGGWEVVARRVAGHSTQPSAASTQPSAASTQPSAVSTHPSNGVGPEEQTGTTKTRRLSTVVAVGVPALLALVIGGTGTAVYERLPHPAEPGYTSLALAGWAAGIAHPVTFPRAGLEVPLEVSSAGEPPRTEQLQVLIGDRAAGRGLPVPIADGTRSLRVHVPSPADGCLHPIRISLGAASTVFYGRGATGPATIGPGTIGRGTLGRGATPC
jgi:hypothetical protein